MTVQKSKTLITILVLLVVVVVIAGAAIGYRNNRSSQHVTTAIRAADAAKLVVMEAATVHGGLDKVVSSELAYNPRSVVNPYVASVVIADGGHITLTTRDTGSTPDPVLLLTPRETVSTNTPAPIAWSCSVIRGSVSAASTGCNSSTPASVPVTPAPAVTVSR